MTEIYFENQSIKLLEDLSGKIILLSLTNRCDQLCKYCFLRLRKADMQEMQRKDIDMLKNKLKEVSIEQIHIGGGEPLISEWLFYAIESLNKLKAKITITTNGIYLNKDNAFRLAENGIYAICISLDSFNPAYNKNMRGQYEKSLDGLYNLLEVRQRYNYKIKIGLYTVLTRYNIDDIENIFNRSKNIGIDYLGFQPVYLPLKHHLHKLLSLRKSDVKVIIERIRYLKNKTGPILPSDIFLKIMESLIFGKYVYIDRCCVGGSILFIDADGSVYVSPNGRIAKKKFALGNIKDRSYKILEKTNNVAQSRCKYMSIECLCIWELVHSEFYRTAPIKYKILSSRQFNE